MVIIHCLTVRQPYASAFFFGPRPKDIENRSRQPPERLIGSRLYIHAGEGLELEGLRLAMRLGYNPLGLSDGDDTPTMIRWKAKRRPMPHGVILGSVLLDGYTRESDSPWRDLSIAYGWVIRDPQPLARPVPVPQGGQLTHGWRAPEDVAVQIIEQEHRRAA